MIGINAVSSELLSMMHSPIKVGTVEARNTTNFRAIREIKSVLV